MLATFADGFRDTQAVDELERIGQPRAHADFRGKDLGVLSPQEMEGVLADTVIKEFKVRLGRIGIEYQTPAQP